MNENQKIIVTLVVVCATAIFAAYVIVKNSQNSNKTSSDGNLNFVTYYNSTTASGYAQTLFNKLSSGDTTLNQCNKFGNQLEEESGIEFHKLQGFGTLLIEYLYLPQKHRCIGLTTSFLYGNENNGNVDQLIDVGVIRDNPSSSSYLASCIYDLKSNKDIGMITTCDDLFGNTFTTIPDNKLVNSMSPMIREVYYELQKLGGQ